MSNSRRTTRSFPLPFKPPIKNGKQVDDFDSLAKTPSTPVTKNANMKTPSNADRSMTKTNKRTIKDADIKAPAQLRKSARFKTPVQQKKMITEECTPQRGGKTNQTGATDRTKSRKQFETPQQPCESTKMKTPVSENTQAKLDFDFLETTPLLSEKNTAQGASDTPATNNDDQDFDSLGNTPATEKVPKRGVEKATTDVGANVELQGSADTNSSNAQSGRSQRKRKQTEFFGDVKDSSKADIMVTKSVVTGGTKPGSNSVSESNESGSESDESVSNMVVKSKRRNTASQRKQSISQNMYQRRSVEMVPKNDRFLEVHEVAHHPSLAKHRGWETDGVRAWAKPHPLPIMINPKFTEQEIQAARNFSPGPPVCPWLVRSTCYGRYPMDDMANRIALEMRRNFQIFFRMKRRMVERGLGKKVHFITAVRQNLICKTEDTLRYLLCKLYFMTKRLKMFTTQNFIDCLDLLAEIYIAKYWHPRVKPIVDEFFEKIESKVLEDMDRHRFSPLFMETFIRLKIPYTGKSVIPKGSKIRVVKPGSGPPFLTPREFEKKFGVKPKVYTDEELTRIYDSVGNVIGHFTVPNLRELLTPITEQVEAQIEKEDKPMRLKQRKIRKWSSSDEARKKFFMLKKAMLLNEYENGTNNATTGNVPSILERARSLHISRGSASSEELSGREVSPQGSIVACEIKQQSELDSHHVEARQDNKVDCKVEPETSVEL